MLKSKTDIFTSTESTVQEKLLKNSSGLKICLVTCKITPLDFSLSCSTLHVCSIYIFGWFVFSHQQLCMLYGSKARADLQGIYACIVLVPRLDSTHGAWCNFEQQVQRNAKEKNGSKYKRMNTVHRIGTSWTCSVFRFSAAAPS